MMRLIPHFIFLVTLALLMAAPARAQDSEPAAPAASSAAIGDKKADQARLKERTQQIIQQLDAIILEYERNGLVGDQVEDLKKTRLLLSNSSLEEMRKILNKLDQAQTAGSDSEARGFLMGAYSGQLAVLVQLRDMVNEYNQKRDVTAVPAILQELVQRQEGNMEAAISLAQSIKPGKPLNEYHIASMDSQYEEQRDLAEQFNYVISTIEIIASNGDPETANLYKGALSFIQQKRIVGNLAGAREALDQNQAFSAVSYEKASLTGMKELIAYLTPKPPRSERLMQLAERLEKVIEEQTLIARDAENKVSRLHDMNSIASHQGVILQESLSIYETAQVEAPDAAGPIYRGMSEMRKARRLMPDRDENTRRGAAVPALKAVSFLEEALGLLQQAAEEAAQQEQQQGQQDQQEQLADFAAKLQKLIQWQTALNVQTRRREKTGGDLAGLKTEQDRIRNSTNYLQKDAQASNPEPAEILGRAAIKMTSASGNMGQRGRGALVLSAQDEALELLLLAAQQTANEQAAQEEQMAEENQQGANEEQLAQADNALDEAEQATNDAINDLDQGNEDEALENIEDALEALEGADEEQQAQNEQGQEGEEGEEGDDAQAQNEQGQEAQEGEEGEEGEAGEEMQAEAEGEDGEEGQEAGEEMQAEAEGEEGEEGEMPGEEMQAEAEGEEGEEGEMPGEEMQAEAEGEEGEEGEMPGEEMQAQAEGEEAEGEQPRGELPPEAQQAIEQAHAALEAAENSLEQGNTEAAKAQAQEALDAIHQAKKAVGEAQAEAESGELVAEIEAQQAGGEMQEGEQAAGGEAQEQKGEPGESTAEAEGEGESEEMAEASDTDDPDDEGKLSSTGAKETTPGQNILGEGEFTGLPEREREAIRQSMGESYPEEYRAMIEQYRRNLASETR